MIWEVHATFVQYSTLRIIFLLLRYDNSDYPYYFSHPIMVFWYSI